mmetsp:Transcript_427/g.970  ORF Transcript_427/g.970 Transcript_427/m.970 type:complete len:220 (+) Transcript_427:818-1477(+)
MGQHSRAHIAGMGRHDDVPPRAGRPCPRMALQRHCLQHRPPPETADVAGCADAGAGGAAGLPPGLLLAGRLARLRSTDGCRPQAAGQATAGGVRRASGAVESCAVGRDVARHGLLEQCPLHGRRACVWRAAGALQGPKRRTPLRACGEAPATGLRARLRVLRHLRARAAARVVVPWHPCQRGRESHPCQGGLLKVGATPADLPGRVRCQASALPHCPQA